MITGKKIEQEKINEANAFDAFKEDVHKRRISRNTTKIP